MQKSAGIAAYSDLNIYTIIMAGCQLLSQIIISFVVIKDVKISRLNPVSLQ